MRCGVIFARLHQSARIPQSAPLLEGGHSGQSVGDLLFRFYRIFRWLTLAGLIVVIVLILHPSQPPNVVSTPQAAQRAEAKVQEFASFEQTGRERTLEMDEMELNGWLGTNLALKRTDKKATASPFPAKESAISLAKKAMALHAPDNPTLEQAQSSVRDIKIELREDTLLAYVVFDRFGMDLSLELEGRLLARDGYLCLEPLSGKLGSLPLMAGTLQTATHRLFDSPENKEKFRLPPNIQDMRIEGGRLIISSR